jgi:hypothetical protein
LQATRARPTPKLAKEPQDGPTIMTVTKKIFFTTTLILFLTDILAQDKASYDFAFNEITKMLKGEEKLGFKRAVFLTENAFTSNKTDYKEFCRKIDNIETQLNLFMRDKGITNHPIGKQFAIFNYMMEPSKYNDNVRLTYDFNDLTGRKDWTKQFVSKLLRTKKGNCHSLPYLYKILSEELGAEAYLALAPNHLYIKHKDPKGLWANVELTNSSFPRDGWVISSLSITTEAIKNEIYMEPLSLKESIAMTLTDLALGYKFHFGHDAFTMKCLETTIVYFPNYVNAHMIKSEILGENYKKSIAANNNKPNKEIFKLEKEIAGLYNKIDSMGYKEMPREQYEQWVKDVETMRENQNQNTPSNKPKN